MKVYVVDDDTALRTAYTAALHKLGYDVDTGVDGLEARALMQQGLPDLLLIDMLMPNLDGIAFLREFRSDPANLNVKVVVVSNMELLEDAHDLQITRYMSKIQFTPEAVAYAIDTILKGDTVPI